MGLLRQRLVAHHPKVGTGEDPGPWQAHHGADLRRHQRVVAGDHLERDTEAPKPRDGFGDAWLRGIIQHQEPQERHPGLVVLGDRLPPAFHLSPGHAQGAKPLGAERLVTVPNGRGSCSHRNGAVNTIGLGAHLEHVEHGPLGHHDPPWPRRRQYAEPFPSEVVRHLIESRPAGEIDGALRADRRIDRVGETSLEGCVQEGVEEHPLARLARRIHGGVKPYRSLGQGAGLVGTEDVHAAEVLDRRQSFDDDFFGRHLAGALGEIDADDRR